METIRFKNKILGWVEVPVHFVAEVTHACPIIVYEPPNNEPYARKLPCNAPGAASIKLVDGSVLIIERNEEGFIELEGVSNE